MNGASDWSPVRLVASSLTFTLLSIAAIHVYWAVRGVGAGTGVPSHQDGTPVFRPGRVATLGVALALIAAALLVAGRAGLIDVGLAPIVLHVGVWGVATTFAARTIGEFRYVGVFKRVRGTAFARWDTRLFTPLCALMAAAAVVVARS